MDSITPRTQDSERLLRAQNTKSSVLPFSARPGLRVYLETSKRRPSQTAPDAPCKECVRVRVYDPALYAATGKCTVERRSPTPGLIRLAETQRKEREGRKKLRAALKAVRRGRIGRPSQYGDRSVLDYLACMRRGEKIVQCASMSWVERARRMYSLLPGHWRRRLTPDDYTNLHRLVRSARGRAAAKREKWNPSRAVDEALQTVLADKADTGCDDGT